MAKPNEPIAPGGGRIPLPNTKRGIGQFLKEVGLEMRRVIWPSKAETFRLTTAVILVCVLFVVYLWIASEIVGLVIRLMETGKV